MNIYDIIGYAAGILIMISMIPQLYTIIINKSGKNISISTYFILWSSQILWLIYALHISDTQLLLSSTSSLIIISFIISFTIFYNRKESLELDALVNAQNDLNTRILV